MKFYVQVNKGQKMTRAMIDEIIVAFQGKDHELTANPNDAGFVLNFTDLKTPVVFHRRSRSVAVISIVGVPSEIPDFRSLCYTGLVRTLSNMLICVVTGAASRAFFSTPECGFNCIPYAPNDIAEKVLPIATSHFAIDNIISTDLPRPYWYSSPAVESIKRYAKEMDRLGVLPTPFPLKSVLTKENMRRVYRLFGVTGLSYGNLSAREKVGGFGNSTFWMTGRGVDKAHLERPGKDIFLVKGLDTRGEKVLVSAPPDYNRQARVSVDAIEHALIYEAFPKVEAIMHIHAWINGAIETRQSYPCGTIEMAKEVVSILKTSGHPEREAVGLINHGLTLTGNSFEDIFDRIWDHLIKEIPLAA